ncbi:MAG: SpoIIIAH-like family protein [Clostridia bacterium]|nr:SpoIIIAH-like family protein [Clostridia bacterium]MDE7328676.1 SpoIIIAH-like family protein [Clostridia bacterium]
MAKKEKTKKLSSNGKKALVLCCMVALLVVTGVLNYVLNTQIKDGNNPNDVVDNLGDGAAVETFFASHRSNRETARAEEFSYLDAIISSEATSETVKASAEEKQVELLSFIEQELVLESLIKAKGFEDAVVTMSTNNLNVIVKQAELTKEEVAQILGTILQETNYTASQVYVVPYTA